MFLGLLWKNFMHSYYVFLGQCVSLCACIVEKNYTVFVCIKLAAGKKQ